MIIIHVLLFLYHCLNLFLLFILKQSIDTALTATINCMNNRIIQYTQIKRIFLSTYFDKIKRVIKFITL